MKIFFLITGLGVGGAERQVVSLCDQMAALGHEITLCYITGAAKILPENKAVRVIALNAKKTPFSLSLAFFYLRKLLRQIRPDIIHAHMVHANIMARFARIGFKSALICTAHNTNEGGKLRMFAYRISDFLADITTNVSDEAVQSFIAAKAAPKERIITMYNGIDTDKFVFDELSRAKIRAELKVAEKTKVLIAVGRLSEAKDYPNLLRACARIEGDFVLWIAGDGDEKQKKLLEIQIGELSLNSKVKLLGLRCDIPELLSAADIFILSSAWEGFGLVVAEAMLCQRVAVVTDSGGVSEVLGQNGYLTPVKNAEILSQNIQKAMSLPPEKAESLGKSAREHIVKNFSLSKITARWIELYQKILSEKSR